MLFLIVLMIHYLIVLYSNGQVASPNYGVTLPTFILNVAQDAVMLPLASFVGHITYFGPVVCLSINQSHFPMQLFFMNFGTWVTPLSYTIDAVIAIIVCFFLYRVFFIKQENTSAMVSVSLEQT